MNRIAAGGPPRSAAADGSSASINVPPEVRGQLFNRSNRLPRRAPTKCFAFKYHQPFSNVGRYLTLAAATLRVVGGKMSSCLLAFVCGNNADNCIEWVINGVGFGWKINWGRGKRSSR
jgi:hypothetical protein